jgi:hypothetical protein
MPRILRLASLLAAAKQSPPQRTTLPEQFISRKHAAQLLDCSVQLIDRLIRDNLLPSYHLGGRTLICVHELIALVRSGVIDCSPGGDR